MKYAFAAALYSLTLFSTMHAEVKRPDPKRFESEVAAFDKQPKPTGEILFLGSSSIRLWDTKGSFPKRQIINRGFGGSMIQDSLFYFDRLAKPFAPKLIVFYAGDNDLAEGLSAEEALADYKKLSDLAAKELPEAHMVYISIKPSIQRWKLWPEMRKANNLIRAFSEAQPKRYFVDIAPVTIGEDGQPKKDFFQDDGLHLNAKGYEAWSVVVEKKLREILP